MTRIFLGRRINQAFPEMVDKLRTELQDVNYAQLQTSGLPTEEAIWG